MVKRVDQRALRRKIDQWLGPHDAITRLRMAVERHDGPPAKRLADIVDMAHADLRTMDPGAREALGYSLRGVAALSLDGGEGYRFKLKPIPDGELAKYLHDILSAIRGLLSDPPVPWEFPADPRVVVTAAGKFAVRLGGNEPAAILGAVANLLVEAGEHLRQCPGCGKPFVPLFRQKRYCGSSCSMRVRNAKRLPRAKVGK
jgi:hypothetical protein